MIKRKEHKKMDIVDEGIILRLIEAHNNKDEREFGRTCKTIVKTFGQSYIAELIRNRIYENANEESDSTSNDSKALRYSIQLSWLNQLRRSGMISDDEHARVLRQLRKDYDIVSEWSPKN